MVFVIFSNKKARHPFRETFRSIDDIPTMYSNPFKIRKKLPKVISLNNSEISKDKVIKKPQKKK